MKKVVLITGASSGIGRSLALQAAKKGYDLAIIARNENNLNAVAAACRALGAKVSVTVGDVSIYSDCERFIQTALHEFGAFHILINNAGLSMRAVFSETDIKVIETLMAVNFWGTIYCTRLAMEELLKHNGSVVGISSVAGFKGLPGRTGYSASKFAMNGFLESLRTENLHTGLHVLIASPGYTKSNIRKTALNAHGEAQEETPLHEDKLMHPDVVARLIWKAIEKRRKYLIMTPLGKAFLFVNKIWPRLADYLAFNFIRKEPGSPFH
ncbi:MAG: SDR family oxidoreductase [Bacteroidetes bacterium]|nr:SDR family oxidoreductase [Bacteroidota bacterium]